jgi:hypothetical protein
MMRPHFPGVVGLIISCEWFHRRSILEVLIKELQNDDSYTKADGRLRNF